MPDIPNPIPKSHRDDLMITKANFLHPEYVPCFVCGEDHPVYFCCVKCDFATHICGGCGEHQGHFGIHSEKKGQCP